MLLPIIAGLAGLLVIVGLVFLLVKGVRVSKRQCCRQGEWSTIIFNFGTGFGRVFNISFRNAMNEAVSGEYLERRFTWVFPQEPTGGKLSSNMSFRRDLINAIYILKIRPDQDVEVTIE